MSIMILNEIYSCRIKFHVFFIGVRPLMMKAGSAKAPLTSTTKVTPESLELVQNNLDRVHDAFREMVSKARRGLWMRHVMKRLLMEMFSSGNTQSNTALLIES